MSNRNQTTNCFETLYKMIINNVHGGVLKHVKQLNAVKSVENHWKSTSCWFWIFVSVHGMATSRAWT